MAEAPSRPEREVLLEFRQIGNSVKVTAVDPLTMTEVSLVGPAGSGEAALRRAAIDKLNYVLRKGKSAAR